MRIVIAILAFLAVSPVQVLRAQDIRKTSGGVKVLFFSKGQFYHAERTLIPMKDVPRILYWELSVIRFWQNQAETFRLPLRLDGPTSGRDMNLRSAFRFRMVGDVLYDGSFAVDRLSYSLIVAMRVGGLAAFAESNWEKGKEEQLAKSFANEKKKGNLWFPLGWGLRVLMRTLEEYYLHWEAPHLCYEGVYSWTEPVPDIFVDFYPVDDKKMLLFVLYSPTLPKSIKKDDIPVGSIEVFECGANFAMKDVRIGKGRRLLSDDLVEDFDGLKLRETIQTEMNEPFTVFLRDKSYVFVTASGKAYCREQGESKTKLLWSGNEPPITTVVTNVDSGDVFAFAEGKGNKAQEKRKAIYFNLENNIRRIPCMLEPITDKKVPESIRNIKSYSDVLVRDKKIQR
jgi:hypothetical protein